MWMYFLGLPLIQRKCKYILHETSSSQIILHNNVVDGGHYELNLSRVCCTSEMGIYLLLFVLIEQDELVPEEGRGLVEIVV